MFRIGNLEIALYSHIHNESRIAINVIRQLTYLVTLEREKHFGRAAQACNVSQPALSGAIQELMMD
nr:LysR family transcriptional regulator [Collimonas sp. OK307]